jgi:hypothetical protein
MFVESTSIAAANSLHDIKVHRDRRVCFENASALDFRRVIFLGPFLFLFIHSGVLGPNCTCTRANAVMYVLGLRRPVQHVQYQVGAHCSRK